MKPFAKGFSLFGALYLGAACLGWMLARAGEPAKPPQLKFITTPSPAAVMEFKASGPQYITINSSSGKLAVIAPDGSVKLYGKPNEAARVFWQAVTQVFPQFCERPHALTKSSGYNDPHGHTTQTLEGGVQRATPLAPSLTNGQPDPHRGNGPSANQGASGPRVHPKAPPVEDSGQDGIF